jgi:hypothetical protein
MDFLTDVALVHFLLEDHGLIDDLTEPQRLVVRKRCLEFIEESVPDTVDADPHALTMTGTPLQDRAHALRILFYKGLSDVSPTLRSRLLTILATNNFGEDSFWARMTIAMAAPSDASAGLTGAATVETSAAVASPVTSTSSGTLPLHTEATEVVGPAVVSTPTPPRTESRAEESTSKRKREKQPVVVVCIVTDDEGGDEEDDEDGRSLHQRTGVGSISTPTPVPARVVAPIADVDRNATVDDDDEVVITGTSGPEPLSDYPHPRCNCMKTPNVNPHGDVDQNKSHCGNCYCYVCDLHVENCVDWPLHCSAVPDGRWCRLREFNRTITDTSRNREPLQYMTMPCADYLINVPSIKNGLLGGLPEALAACTRHKTGSGESALYAEFDSKYLQMGKASTRSISRLFLSGLCAILGPCNPAPVVDRCTLSRLSPSSISIERFFFGFISRTKTAFDTENAQSVRASIISDVAKWKLEQAQGNPVSTPSTADASSSSSSSSSSSTPVSAVCNSTGGVLPCMTNRADLMISDKAASTEYHIPIAVASHEDNGHPFLLPAIHACTNSRIDTLDTVEVHTTTVPELGNDRELLVTLTPRDDPSSPLPFAGTPTPVHLSLPSVSEVGDTLHLIEIVCYRTVNTLPYKTGTSVLIEDARLRVLKTSVGSGLVWYPRVCTVEHTTGHILMLPKHLQWSLPLSTTASVDPNSVAIPIPSERHVLVALPTRGLCWMVTLDEKRPFNTPFYVRSTVPHTPEPYVNMVADVSSTARNARRLRTAVLSLANGSRMTTTTIKVFLPLHLLARRNPVFILLEPCDKELRSHLYTKWYELDRSAFQPGGLHYNRIFDVDGEGQTVSTVTTRTRCTPLYELELRPGNGDAWCPLRTSTSVASDGRRNPDAFGMGKMQVVCTADFPWDSTGHSGSPSNLVSYDAQLGTGSFASSVPKMWTRETVRRVHNKDAGIPSVRVQTHPTGTSAAIVARNPRLVPLLTGDTPCTPRWIPLLANLHKHSLVHADYCKDYFYYRVI